MLNLATQVGGGSLSVKRSFQSTSSILDRKNAVDPDRCLSNHQLIVDCLVGDFTAQAANWQSLTAITAGGMAYRIGRLGVMGLGSGIGIRAASLGLGLAAEVSAFELTHRGLTTLSRRGGPMWPPALESAIGGRPHGGAPTNHGGSNLWRWFGTGGLRQGLLNSFITFGTLRGAGRIARGENVVIQHLLQDSAMVVGHNVSGALDPTLKPTGTLAEQFLHAEAVNLQIGAGMALAHRFTPAMQALERGMDLSLRTTDVGANPLDSANPMGLLRDPAQPGFSVFARSGIRDGRSYPDGHRQGSHRFPILFPSIVLMAEKKEEKGPSQRPSGFVRKEEAAPEENPDTLDKGWDEGEVTPVRSSRATSELIKAASSTMPPPPSESTQVAQHPQDAFRHFLLEPKDNMNAIDEAIHDYLAFCKAAPEGRKELYQGLSELRERMKIFRDRKERLQYLYSYTKLINHLGTGEPQFWKELEAVGQLMRDPLLSYRAEQVFRGLFVDLAESLWQERPAVAVEMKQTFELLRSIYQSDDVSPDVRGRAMTVYAEFRSFTEQ